MQRDRRSRRASSRFACPRDSLCARFESGRVYELMAFRRWAAPPEWRGSVARHWTIVGQFERNGTVYLIARRNPTENPSPKRLSQREREVVELLANGLTTKEIAFQLGISASTVGVLLFRAAQKIGARTREDLIRMASGQP